MPRFVVLTHDHPVLHWDFMLEQAESLRTWRLAGCPDGVGTIDAEAIDDHRLAYLNYEGPVSGGRGQVRRWDWGEYEILDSTAERLVVRLSGERLRGVASLERTAVGSTWTFRPLSPSN
jgi:hypothetical protein